LHPTDQTRIDDWINRIKYWLDKGLQELYFFMHMHDEAFSPELTVYLVDKLNKTCGLDLKKAAIYRETAIIILITFLPESINRKAPLS